MTLSEALPGGTPGWDLRPRLPIGASSFLLQSTPHRCYRWEITNHFFEKLCVRRLHDLNKFLWAEHTCLAESAGVRSLHRRPSRQVAAGSGPGRPGWPGWKGSPWEAPSQARDNSLRHVALFPTGIFLQDTASKGTSGLSCPEHPIPVEATCCCGMSRGWCTRKE